MSKRAVTAMAPPIGRGNDRGRVRAARALGVNCRTLVNCCDSRQVSRRMRQALGDFRKAGDFGDAGTGVAGHAVGQDDPESDQDDNRQVLEGRVTELEEENRRLRETVAEQAHRLDKLTRLAAAPEAIEDDAGDTGAGEVEEVTGDVQVDDFGPDWRPPRRRPGMPDPGVVTLQETARRGTRLRAWGAVGGRVAGVAKQGWSGAQPG